MIEDERFTHVTICAELCNSALTEIGYLTWNLETREERELLSGPPFEFYRVALQYCFNSEYNKLLEERENPRYPGNHIASVWLLNESIRKTEGQTFESIYQKNLTALRAVIADPFSREQRDLRDKKFAHSDLNEINNPLIINGLTEEQIDRGFKNLRVLYNIINRCASVLGLSVSVRIPQTDDRTHNFIRYHAVYKAYYFKNFIRAARDGYGINKGKINWPKY